LHETTTLAPYSDRNYDPIICIFIGLLEMEFLNKVREFQLPSYFRSDLATGWIWRKRQFVAFVEAPTAKSSWCKRVKIFPENNYASNDLFRCETCRKHVSATCVLPTITTLLRGVQRVLSLWDVMFQKLQLFCFWTLAHKIFRACSPPQGLSKNIKFWGGGPPNFWEIWTKVQNISPHISSPKGILGPILVRGDVGTTGLLNFQNWGTWPPPPILGEFFYPNFHIYPIFSKLSRYIFL